MADADMFAKDLATQKTLHSDEYAIRRLGMVTGRHAHLRDVRMRISLVMVLADMIAITIGVTSASLVRSENTLSAQGPELAAILTAFYLGSAVANNGYDARTLASLSRSIRAALTALALAAMLTMGLGFALKVSDDYSRLALTASLFISASLLVMLRVVLRRYVDRIAPHGLIKRMRLSHGVRVSPALGEALIDVDVLEIEPRLDCPDTLDQIGNLLHGADEVVVSCLPEHRELWSAALKGLGVRVEMEVPEIRSLDIICNERHQPFPTVLVGRGPLNTGDQIVKRSFDLAIVLFILPVLLFITLAVAVLIKLEDGGPVLFRQRRIGQGNRLFTLYKFRSMTVTGADHQGTRSTTRDDKRVTRVGRFLRRTSIDELPQLYNVLRGDMSIVGPRPHAVASRAGDLLFWDVDHRYWWRHAAKPGLTGLAQVRGFRGATDTADDLRNRVHSDLEYLEGWTLWRDVMISAATLKVILHPKAY